MDGCHCHRYYHSQCAICPKMVKRQQMVAVPYHTTPHHTISMPSIPYRTARRSAARHHAAPRYATLHNARPRQAKPHDTRIFPLPTAPCSAAVY